MLQIEAAKQQGRPNPKAFVSRTGSSRGVSKQNGELIAIPHKTVKKSYADNAPRADLKR